MRRVRPTLRVMKSLPETPAILEVLSAIARAKSLASADESARILKRLDLYALDCDLLKDAQREIDSGTPSKHGEATKSFGATVVEARDRSGAGYRGAVVFDGHGDPWLVYAERHDRFHAHVAEVLKRGQREGGRRRPTCPRGSSIRSVKLKRAARPCTTSRSTSSESCATDCGRLFEMHAKWS